MQTNQKKQKSIKTEDGRTSLKMNPLKYFLVKKMPKSKFSFKFVREQEGNCPSCKINE